MSNDPNAPTPQVPPPAPNGDPGAKPLNLTQAQFDHALATRLEVERAKFADYDKYKAAAAKLAEIEAANMTEVDRLKAENEALKAAQAQADSATAALKATVKKRIEDMPEDWRGAVPAYPNPAETLAWLDANAKLWASRNAPNLNPGAQGVPAPTPVKLTDYQKQMAAASGMSEDEYAQWMSGSGPVPEPKKDKKDK